MSVIPANQEVAPAGSRQLGVRVKPIIRLGMGYRDEQRRGAPVKTDYFTVRGDDRAVTKFREIRGEKPKAVEMLLPASIDQALSIQYRAFKGADGDGSLVAVGHTNYALRDYCGGPDLLTVWNQDGTVDQVETLGLDANTREPLDEIAKDLGLELYTTLRAGMPDVLGFGSFFEISTKGKQSTDTLWAKLRELYGLFGHRVTFAVKPLLVIRPSTARPVVVKDGERKRIKTSIFVLDVVVPESIDEMLERLKARNELLAPQGAEHALYGPAPVAQIGPGDAEPEPEWEDAEGEIVDEDGSDTSGQGTPGDGGDQEDAAGQQAAVDGAAGTSTAAPDDDPEPGAGEQAKAPTVAQARKVKLESGMNEGKTLGEVAVGDGAVTWYVWATRNLQKFDPAVAAAILVVAKADVPDAWAAYEERTRG